MTAFGALTQLGYFVCYRCLPPPRLGDEEVEHGAHVCTKCKHRVSPAGRFVLKWVPLEDA